MGPEIFICRNITLNGQMSLRKTDLKLRLSQSKRVEKKERKTAKGKGTVENV